MLRRRGSTGTVVAIVVACVIALFSFFSISSKNDELESANRALNTAYQQNQALQAENEEMKSSHTDAMIQGAANAIGAVGQAVVNGMMNGNQ